MGLFSRFKNIFKGSSYDHMLEELERIRQTQLNNRTNLLMKMHIVCRNCIPRPGGIIYSNDLKHCFQCGRNLFPFTD